MEKRRQLYNEFEKILVDEAPVACLHVMPYHSAWHERVRDFPTNIWGPMSPYDEVWLAE